MMCMFDIFKNCLILRHRRSHDITVVPSTKCSFGLTRSSSTTSIISCTKKQDDLPPLGTLPRNTNHGNGARDLGAVTNHAATWPISLISTQIPEPPSLPARPNSIVGLPSIPEIPKSKSTKEPVNGITVISDYAEPLEVTPIEPEYSEPLDSIDSALPAEKSFQEDEDYPYHDIYEEIRHRDQNREEDLPDVVTSAYASGEQVYQELLDLVKEEEIKEEKRRSQLYLSDTKGSSVNSLDVSSDGSSADSPSPDSNNAIENRDHLQDLYAVPKRNRAEGPRLPPRRVRSSYNRDPNWAPKVPEKSSLLRRSLSDAGGANDDNNEGDREMKETHQRQEEKHESGSDEVTVLENGDQSRTADNVSAVTEDVATAVSVATTTIVIGEDLTATAKSSARATEIALYEELHVRNDRLI